MGISELNRLSERILGAAFAVHTGLGHGLLENVKRWKDGGIHRLVQGDPPSPPPP